MAGLIDTIKLASVLVLAIPAALAGLELLLVRGETLVGGALVGLAVALVVIQHRLELPTSLRSVVLNRVTDAATRDGSTDVDDGDR